MTTRCEKAFEAIALLASGEIDPSARRDLEVHLGSCPACSAEAARVGKTLDLLGRQPASDPGAAYWEAFGPRLRARIALSEERSRSRRRWLSVAAAALLIGGLAFALAVRRGGEEARTPAVRQAAAPPVPRSEPAEARLEDLLRRAASRDRDRREMQAILDEMVPEDPLAIDDAFGSLSPEDLTSRTDRPGGEC